MRWGNVFIVFGCLVIFWYVGFIVFNLLVDIRIDRIRPFVNEKATRIAVEEAMKHYEKAYEERVKEEAPMSEKKRAVQRKVIINYLKRMQDVMELQD